MFHKNVSLLILCAALIGLVPLAQAAPWQQGDPIILVYGQTVDGQIDSTQPSIFYAFDAQTGDVITLTMIVTGGMLDPFIVLNDANRVPLATDDNSGGTPNARLTFVIPLAGRYLIQATSAGGLTAEGGGTFSLNLTAAVGDTQTVPTLPSATPAEAALPEITPTPAGQSDTPVVQGDSVRLLKLQPGATLQDTLTRQVALRFYWFEAQEGDQIAITPEALGTFTPLLVLYNSAFNEITRTASSSGLQTIAAEAGLFFLSVSLPDTNSIGGSYGFILDVSASPALSDNIIEIGYNQSQRGNVDVNIPAVTYRFRGSAGDNVTILMNRAGGDLNSYLYLLDSAGQLLYEDNDSGGNDGNALISYTLPADGIYLIMAARFGQARGTTSGSYVLELRSNAVPLVDAATPEPSVTEAPETEPVLPDDYAAFPPISYGETVEGELSDIRFMDIYVFKGRTGDAITVDLQGQNPDDPNGLDPLLILLDDARIPLAEHDDLVDGVERDSRLEFTLPRTAYYAIVATRFDQDAGTSAGPYTLTLSGPQGTTNTPPVEVEIDSAALLRQLNTIPLTPDAPLQATFNTAAALYSFSANEGTLVDISVTTDPGLDSVLILADENLNEILSSGTGSLTGMTIQETGAYLVVLAPRFGPASGTGGGYILAITQPDTAVEPPIVPVTEGPQTINYGATVSGVIDEENISQIYTFAGTAGDRIQVLMEAAPDSTLDCYLELQDANGTVLEANDDIDPGVIRNSQISTELSADGVYTLIASRYVGPEEDPTTGTFSLTLTRLDENQPEVPSVQSTPEIKLIAYGQTEVGEISDAQYIVFYVFNGTAGDRVNIEIDNISGNLDSVAHLYRSVGDQWIEIASNDDSPTGGTYEAALTDIVLPESGKYLIAVNRYGLDRESTFGTFIVTLNQLP
ncbi:MAG: PPC domain-containing protein [Chloroflexi bacterium]|nr:PPC domain-containing protein [Chloroflexota bacterium]